MTKTILASILTISNLLIFYLALKKSKKQFFSDTFCLAPLTIYVWGDALVLTWFWIIAGVSLLWVSWHQWLKLLIIFFTMRSFFEIIYWLNAQAVGKQYKAPLFKKIKWLNAEQSAILYQLIHFVVVVMGVWWMVIN